ncbi:MAG TPA: glycerol-3-phosphate dehydrogenase/oxidase, partial [Bacteroidetes bacterium]|nr:glycerol-3-phosphate dehydrogenase/oxidase [Bacteroidota bacterium]
MKRDLNQLTQKEFDIVLVGGGIYGVMTAWDAALRGLRVALIESGDFGGATSSNSLKIIHGGLRYIQHADIRRMRESIRERRIMMKIAPHLVYPLEFVIPTYGHFIKGPEAMFVALKINDLVSFDRNTLPDSQKHLPAGKIISREECLRRIPGVDEENLSGGAVWYDAQLYNSERMIFSILHSAVDAGVAAANYVAAKDFIREENRVAGVLAEDQLSGDRFEIRGKLVVNTTGPWINKMLNRLKKGTHPGEVTLAKMMNIVTKPLFDGYSVGVYSKYEYKDRDAVISKGSRLYFITPWRNLSLIGTAQMAYEGDPDEFRITHEDIEIFMKEINEAYPTANLTFKDVRFYYGGLLPIKADYNDPRNVTLTKHYRFIDHKKEDGIDGLLSVVSVKYTTARDVSEKLVNLALQKLGLKNRPSKTAETPVYGGDIDHSKAYLQDVLENSPDGFSRDVMRHLVINYGTAYRDILQIAEDNAAAAGPLKGQT